MEPRTVMKRTLTYGLSVAALVGASMLGHVAHADDEKTRFESSGFLQSLDVFLSEQVKKLRGAEPDKDEEKQAADKLKGMDLHLEGTHPTGEAGFLALSDRRPTFTGNSGDLAARPDFSSLLSPSGTVRGSYGHELFGANSRVGISFGSEKAEDGTVIDRGFEIALESRYRQSLQGLSMTSGFADPGLAETLYTAGVSLGYSGFGIDASVTRQTGQFAEDMAGYEAGFSYSGDSWSARLSMSEYSEGADLVGIENEARNIVSFELGANYRLTERIGLTGGVRYYDYRTRFISKTPDGDTSQMIFLGGRLKF